MYRYLENAVDNTGARERFASWLTALDIDLDTLIATTPCEISLRSQQERNWKNETFKKLPGADTELSLICPLSATAGVGEGGSDDATVFNETIDDLKREAESKGFATMEISKEGHVRVNE